MSSVPRCKWDGKKHLNPGCHMAYTATIPKIFASLYSRFCHCQETECSNCRAASKLSPTHLELLNLQACQAKPKFRPERKQCLFLQNMNPLRICPRVVLLYYISGLDRTYLYHYRCSHVKLSPEETPQSILLPSKKKNVEEINHIEPPFYSYRNDIYVRTTPSRGEY